MKVSNWDRWQSYRSDRGQPPWIKVHRCLMRNEQFVTLTRAQRGDLMCIWLLAADRNGVIPDDPKMIQALCCLPEPPDVTTLIELGFLDATATSPRRQHDAPETETETEKSKRSTNGSRVGSDIKTVSPRYQTDIPGKRPRNGAFTPPTLDEVKSYIKERHSDVDADKWHSFYAAKGWMIGRNKMKDWRAAVRTWETTKKAKEVDWT